MKDIVTGSRVFFAGSSVRGNEFRPKDEQR
jgi:hypothetical protein